MNLRSADPLPLDGISCADLFKQLLQSATYHRDVRNRYRKLAALAADNMDNPAQRGYVDEMQVYDRGLQAIVSPLRFLVKIRGWDEDARAQDRARRGAAFMKPACAAEICLDCDRPLWHHIRLASDEVLCPFGRDYWKLARILSAGMAQEDGETFIRYLAGFKGGK